MSYDPNVVAAIRRIAQDRYKSDPKKLRRYLLGGYATGIVESGLQNLSGGDADSYGFRQQRESIYGRQPLDRQINNLFNEFEQYDRGQTVGQLAAAVQRPAAQYRGRYAQVLDQARALADKSGVPGGSVGNGGGAAPSSLAAPQAAGPNPFSTIAALSANSQNNPYAATLQRGWDLLGKIWEQKYGGQSPGLTQLDGGGISAVGDVADYVSRANKLDAANRAGKLPYKWGGGHGDTPVDPNKPVPVDCSGAVSAVLGIDPRVSGEFEKWGRPGEGGKKGITVYANEGHVLMKINGHFFGTSSANAGGGAGWIPQKKISREYLQNFTARHL